MTLLPIECIELIIANMRPLPRFRIATDLRLTYIQNVTRARCNHTMLFLPIECIELIIVNMRPLPRFRIATDLRLTYIQNVSREAVEWWKRRKVRFLCGMDGYGYG